tara:strand:+ start:5770 stop:7260 length:1491 start_codon:yes stop_codon:yes gene_type:complete
MAESWSKESNTKASGNGTTQDTGFILDSLKSFIVQNSSLTEIFKIDSSVGGNISFGETTDGGDRTIKFGHGTIESCIGIDDSQDVFAINTDASLEDVNDLEINSSGHVRLGQGILQGIESGTLTLEADTSLTLKAKTDIIFQIDSDGNGTETFQFKNGAGTEIAELDEPGNLQIDGDLTVSGNNISSSSGTVFSFSGNDASLTGDLTIIGNNITFPDNQLITSNGEHIQFKAIGTDDRMLLYLSSQNPGTSPGYADGEDAGIIFEANNESGQSLKWSNQLDVSTQKDSTDSLKWDYNVTAAGTATMMELTKIGALKTSGNLAVAGQNIGSALATDGTVSGAINFPGAVTFQSSISGVSATFTDAVRVKQPYANLTNGLYIINDAETTDPETIQGIAEHVCGGSDSAIFATIAAAETSVLLYIQENNERNFNISHCTRDDSGNTYVTTLSNHDIVCTGLTTGANQIRYTDGTNDMSSRRYKIIQLGGDGHINAITSS